MFDQLLLQEPTKSMLLALSAQPPQSVLFVGPVGVGKMTTAAALAAAIVEHPTSIRIISPEDKGGIAIETIRDLYKSTRSKQKGRQVIIIERADLMSIEAENAFLKLLEEPRAGLTFILTCLQLEALLPTIQSRIQHVAMQPLPDETIRQLIVSKRPGIAQSDLAQIVFLAHGRPGAALNLLESDALSGERERMQLVKQLLGAKPHDRYVLTGKLSASRDEALETLGAMARVVEIQLSSAASSVQARRWADIADAIEGAMGAISRNGNVRAQLLYLFSRY